MKKYKIAATIIIRPYMTVSANSKKEAREKAENGEFDDLNELIETGVPISQIEVDEIYFNERREE